MQSINSMNKVRILHKNKSETISVLKDYIILKYCNGKCKTYSPKLAFKYFKSLSINQKISLDLTFKDMPLSIDALQTMALTK